MNIDSTVKKNYFSFSSLYIEAFCVVVFVAFDFCFRCVVLNFAIKWVEFHRNDDDVVRSWRHTASP